MRNEEWLATVFHRMWETRFSDVTKKNNVVVRWRGKWKNKFGHIRRLKNKDTEIVINALFKDERVPEYIIELTLAHELVHYMHGFHSPYPKLFKHPHKGGIVNSELKLRGYEDALRKEKEWFKSEWLTIYAEHSPDKINMRQGRVVVHHLRNGFGLF